MKIFLLSLLYVYFFRAGTTSSRRICLKVYVISYPKLNHMFAGFGWLFWIFVYILAAQISAGQAGPEFKKVRQTQQSHDLTADKKWRRL